MSNEQQSMADHQHGLRFVDDDGRCLACALSVAEDRIRELEAEVARRDSFDGCDGCSTGDCPHDFEYQCIDAQGELIREQAARISELEQQNEQMRKANFIHSRMEITGKLPSAYTDEELVKMFAPWWEERCVEGLSPREVRLLETIVDRNLQIRRVLLRCRCVFCGHEFESEDHVATIKAHILRCDKHPLHAITQAAGDQDPLALIEAAKRMPMTKDKKRVAPGDHIFVVHSESDISELVVGDYEKRTITSHPDMSYARTWHCHSTREAAEAAKKEDDYESP